jgi:predicted PhzF superfamily epimerase YddE/YHI9
MKIEAKLVRSFTQNPEYGNPAGVVLDANKLSDEQILKATQILGFPESAFIWRGRPP